MSETNVVQLAPNRTKIVATIGPGSRTPAVLRKLIEVGVDVFRLNFSHGTHDEHSAVLADIRTLSRELGQHVAILQDLCGPKIRLGPIPGDVVDAALGEEFTLVAERSSNSPRELTCSYRELPNDLKLGETVLFADGTVAMVVTNTEPGRARLKVTLRRTTPFAAGAELTRLGISGQVANRQGSQRSRLDQHGTQMMLILSDCRSCAPRRMSIRLRRELQERKCPARVVVKIEKPQAVQHLEEIIAVTDCVMVARGTWASKWTCSGFPLSRSGSSHCATRPTVL